MKSKKLLLGLLSIFCLCFSLVGLTSCNENNESEYDPYYYTNGLLFSLLEDGENYSIIGYNGKNSNVIIPATYKGLPVTSIGDGAFKNCEFLITIIIPDSVTNIGYTAFGGCVSLMKITIPNGITTIKNGVFVNCKALSTIVIPDSVTEIGNGAFMLCYSLRTVYYTGTEEQWNSITINFNNDAALTNANIIYNYVPEEE